MVGKDALLDIARAWVQTNNPPETMGIGLRLSILEGVL